MCLSSNEEMETVAIVSGGKRNFEDNTVIFPCCNSKTLIPTACESFLKVTQPPIGLRFTH